MGLMYSVFLRSSATPRPKKACHGFSLVEVLITLAIISVLTVLVMVRYSSFDSAVLLQNQAFEIALDLREAQSYAISVRGEGNEFREEYGLYFNKNTQPQEYTFWLDNGDTQPTRYQSDTDTTLEVRGMDQRFTLQDICVNDDTCGVINLSVSFARPNFDAMIVRGNGNVVNNAEIVVASVRDSSRTKTIRITSAGQITVQ